MRIIAGDYKGRQLVTVKEMDVRPATDRVKGTIFNMLQNRVALNGANVLDIFAGSGSLGFEAMSRGAKRVVFVEKSSDTLKTIKQNAEALNCSERCDIHQTSAISYIEQCDEQFHLIFADPPYKFEKTPLLPSMIFKHKLLKNGGFLIIEHSKNTAFDTAPEYQLKEQREFGMTRLSFFTHSEMIP